jgi:hypothetical protein
MPTIFHPVTMTSLMVILAVERLPQFHQYLPNAYESELIQSYLKQKQFFYYLMTSAESMNF